MQINALYLPRAPAAVVAIDITDFVLYLNDVADPADLARITTDTQNTLNKPRNFASVFGIGDIIAVDGMPVKGTASLCGSALVLHPTDPIKAIADTDRMSFRYWTLDLLTADGKTQIGTIQAGGPNGGAPPAGAPVGLKSGNYAIVGGTGAFLGVRGQMGQLPPPTGAPQTRTASMREDPHERRTLHGGTIKLGLLLMPMFAPQILRLISGDPAVLRSNGSQVSPTNRARAGDVLSIFATGLGPTSPGIDPGDTFPATPLNVVAPIDVKMGGKAAKVDAAFGHPGSTSVYRIDFQVPNGISSGHAYLELRSAWVKAPSVDVWVQ